MTNFLDRLVVPENPGLDPALLVPLLRLLDDGQPVALDTLRCFRRPWVGAVVLWCTEMVGTQLASRVMLSSDARTPTS